jgi:hypothetical protein
LRGWVASEWLPSGLPAARSARRRLPSRGSLGPQFPTFPACRSGPQPRGTLRRYDCHDSGSASFGCPSCAATLVWSSSALPASSQDHVTLLGSEVCSPGAPIRPCPRSGGALPSSRVTPLMPCPALSPRWCPGHSPERTQDCCLPAPGSRRLSPPSRGGLSWGPPLSQVRGSSTRPATSLPPAPRLQDWLRT